MRFQKQKKLQTIFIFNVNQFNKGKKGTKQKNFLILIADEMKAGIKKRA